MRNAVRNVLLGGFIVLFLLSAGQLLWTWTGLSKEEQAFAQLAELVDTGAADAASVFPLSGADGSAGGGDAGAGLGESADGAGTGGNAYGAGADGVGNADGSSTAGAGAYGTGKDGSIGNVGSGYAAGADLASTPVLPQYTTLLARNSDFAGWLRISGTNINYPVMYTPDEPEYYLHRGFDKRKSFSGVPFIGESSAPDAANILIYGHHMKNGTMFADLVSYAKKTFWQAHPVIHFSNLHQENTYEIIGAFYSKDYGTDEKGFAYYQYADLQTQEAFESYVKQVKAVSIYDTGITAAYGDQLLTLSTCSYHVKDGRFVVVARRAGK